MFKKIIFSLLLLLINFSIFCFEETGNASWYGPKFYGKKTANGEIFNPGDYTAAHKTLPLGSIVKVISIENNKDVIVRINDRGPFIDNRIIDLSRAAASKIGMIQKGTMKVKVILLEKGNNIYHRYNAQKYIIQIASFKEKEKAEFLHGKLKQKGFPVAIKKINLKNTFYRVIIDNINYSELQLYRVKLQNEGLNNYLVIKI